MSTNGLRVKSKYENTYYKKIVFFFYLTRCSSYIAAPAVIFCFAALL